MAKKDKGDFMSRAGKATKKGYRITKEKAIKVGSKGVRSYGRYVAPTVGLFKKAGSVALGATKLAARFPGTGLIGTAAYYGAKHIIKKGERSAARSAFKTFDKKGRWML